MNLRQRRSKMQTLRGERGATDPILVIAAIAVSLILLIGGSFAVQGIITNGKDLNAKSDLDKVAVAEVAFYAQSDHYVAYEKGGTVAQTELERADIGFRPTEDPGSDLAVELEGTLGWNAISKSSSGAKFVKTSQTNLIVTVGAQTPADLTQLGMTPAEFAALAEKV